MRNTLSVLAGFVIWTILFLLSNQVLFRLFPERFDADMVTTDGGLLGATLFLTTLFSVLAGLATARVAPSRPLAHAVALGVLQTLIGLGVQSGYWNVLPSWYNVAFVVFLLPATIVGGWIQVRRSMTSVD